MDRSIPRTRVEDSSTDSIPHPPPLTAPPSRCQQRPGQLKAAKTHLEEPIPRYAAPGTLARTTEYAESSNRHVIAQAYRPRSTSQTQHSPGRTKSDSRKPCTPASSLTTSDTVSPPSVITISPISPAGRARRHRAYSTTSQTSRQRPAALKLDKLLSKNDISPPIPSPIYANFDSNVSYEPQRRPPTTPPLQVASSASPGAAIERSFMEWEDETSALSKMKQTLKLGQNKRAALPPSRPPRQTAESLDRQDNAIPRPLPTRSKPQSPPNGPNSIRQPLKSSNFSRPRKTPTCSYMPQTSASAGNVFYQGPDLTGRSVLQQPGYELEHSYNKIAKQRRPTTDQLPRARLPQRVHRPQASRTSPAAAETPRRPLSKTQVSHTRRVDIDYDHEDSKPGRSPFLANEAVAVEPPPPTPTTTTTTADASTERPRRLKALMKGLVHRASGRDLKKEREKDTSKNKDNVNHTRGISW